MTSRGLHYPAFSLRTLWGEVGVHVVLVDLYACFGWAFLKNSGVRGHDCVVVLWISVVVRMLLGAVIRERIMMI